MRSAAAHWGKAVSQSALFTEDRIRRWTGQPAELVGVELMTAVFGPNGICRLGETEEERKGWHLLAMGLVKAVRNAAGHRLQNRPDHRRYALGAIAASSLLLTQLRFEHGDRLVDRSPAHPDAAPSGPPPRRHTDPVSTELLAAAAAWSGVTAAPGDRTAAVDRLPGGPAARIPIRSNDWPLRAWSATRRTPPAATGRPVGVGRLLRPAGRLPV